MSGNRPGPASDGEVWRVPAAMVPEVSGRRMGLGDVAVLVVGVLLALLGTVADLFVTVGGALLASLGGRCHADSTSAGCRYYPVWALGPWLGLGLAVVVGVVVGRRRWGRGRSTWPALPVGLALYLPLLAVSFRMLN